MKVLGAAAYIGAAISLSCGRSGSSSTDGAPIDPIAPLHVFEEERHRAADFERAPASDHTLGPDPIAIRALPGAGDGRPARFAGLLRGRDAIVLLDASLREIARAPAPAAPTGIAVAEDDEIYVSGEQSPTIARYRVLGDALRDEGRIDVARAAHPGERPYGLRDVAAGGTRERRVIYAVDERSGALFVVPLLAEAAPGKVIPVCAGAFRVARAGDRLIVDCLLDHALVVLDLDRSGVPIDGREAVIRHDGPIWGFDATQTPEGLLIAAGGVEDHPLDRREGSFGFIDSFVFLYRVPPAGKAATMGGLPPYPPATMGGDPPYPPAKLAEVNVSEHGVITPKAISLRALPGGGVTVLAAGYGADRLAEITWPPDLHASPAVTTRPILPGAASMAVDGDTLAFADPLLDAWFPLSSAPVPVPVPVPDPPSPRTSASLVGEALFFTNLMAPWNKSEGRLSRFTCETCHFEGYVDGRTHHTGRGNVHATTKPLLGLFNNRPHFTRALDHDMASMVHSEFRVAGSLSDHDPWFSAADAALPWTPLLAARPEDLDALGLRRSLMTFLMDFTHRPNPAALGRTVFTLAEQRGAGVFAARCERCHEARLVADEPGSRVPRARWESLVLSREGPLVWAASGYHKTGVEPYVHEEGARATSLRRSYKKHPYFTNGSAQSVRDVVERARFRGDAFWHDGAPAEAEGLSEEERGALEAFLELL